MNEWEKAFFEKAYVLRDNIKKSNSSEANLNLSILAQIVEQVFLSAGIPDVLLLSPVPRYSRNAFYNAVKKVFKKLGIKYELSRKIISSSDTKVNYAYVDRNHSK